MSYPQDQIYDIVTSIAGMTVIWRDQNAPRPTKPYMTLGFGTSNPSDHPTRGALTVDGKQDVTKWVTSVLQVMCYGSDSYMRLLDLSTRLGFTTVGDRCQAANIGLGRFVSLNNLPVAVDKSQYEDRSILELEVLWVNTLTDEPGRIEQVVVTGSDTGAAVPVPFCVGTVSSP